MSDLPVGLVADDPQGVRVYGHVSWHNRLHEEVNVGRSFVNLKSHGATGNGVDNDSAAVTAALTVGPSGAMVRVPSGDYRVDPGVLKLLSSRHIQGDGCDSTWFTLRSDTPGAALDLDITGPGVRGNYGARVRGIGINLINAPSAIGIRLGAPGGDGLHANWVDLDDIRVEGGTISIDCQAANNKIRNFHLINPSVGFVRATEKGLELRMWDGVLDVSPGFTVPNALDFSVATGGIKGAVYLRDIALNNGGIVSRGIWVHCPDGATASLPVRCTHVTLDNLAGPGYDLVNVTDAQVMGGWVNSALGTGNGAFRFYGGGQHTVMGVQQLNGGTDGCSFDFAGGSPSGIVLIGNAPATGPIYRLSATGKPTNLLIADRIADVAARGNVTNDPEGLRAAMAKLWTPPMQAEIPYRRNSGSNPPAGHTFLVNGAVTVPHTSVQVNTRVRVTRERIIGPAGNLFSSLVDNVVGASFTIRSDQAGDNGGVYWEMHDPV